VAEVSRTGVPAYTTSAGWLGYPDEKIKVLLKEALGVGWTRFKLKVGANLEDDLRRLKLMRSVVGDAAKLMVDANQRWEVDEAIPWIRALSPLEPLWIEEPTSPDDILGNARIASAVAPVQVAMGEHVHNRVMFKQLFQSKAIGFCQLDCTRLAGINEAIVVMLMAKKFGVPVCPHSGGVGLSEYGQHLSIFDFARVGCSMDDRMLEYVDHLHEHFVDPVVMKGGRYCAPSRAGASVEMLSRSIAANTFAPRSSSPVTVR
jgi:L-fuconate dehydratase